MELNFTNVEKIEIDKGKEHYFYTGQLRDLSDGWVEIHTNRGEIYRFRKEQVVQRLINPEKIDRKIES
jgi:hypothetical protein